MQLLNSLVLLLTALTVAASAASAAPKADTRPTTRAAPSPKSAPSAPSGLAALKLGITKGAVEALPRDGEVVVSMLSETDSKGAPGTRQYTSLLKSALTREPARLTLTFQSDVLVAIGVSLDENSSATAQELLTAKYGVPQTKQRGTDETCFFVNGASLKVPRKAQTLTWSGRAEDGQTVEATLTALNYAVCPASLDEEPPVLLKIHGLTFSRPTADEARASGKGLF